MAYKESYAGRINRKLNKKLHVVEVAAGRQKADLVLKNATYVNVFCNQLSRGDIAVAEGLIAGMGGETIRTVLLSGADKLSGAVLVLSSHTEQPLVRRTLPEIGYHIVQEKLCQAAGRFYIFWRAEPGQADDWTAEEVHYGRLLWVQNPPKMLLDYCRYRIKVMADRLTGLASATGDVSRIRGEIAAEIDFYQRKITELEGAPC